MCFISRTCRVSDAQEQNLETCAGVKLLAQSSMIARSARDGSSPNSMGLLEVAAAHGYGTVRVSYEVYQSGNAGPGRVYFRVNDTSLWNGDPVEKHIAFGQFWTGVIDPGKSPIIMGKVQVRQGIRGQK